MRHIILTAAFVLTGSAAAMATSLLTVDEAHARGADSVVSKSCAECPPLVVDVVKKSYIVPELMPGTQKVEVRETGGRKTIARTEAWMGGSPVVFISKATPGALAAMGEPVDGVDPTTTTAVAQSAKQETLAAPKPLDTSRFDLRMQ
jgi:hypothetical protein